MKLFNLEEAKAGKPVVTRDGRPVRIIYYDRKNADYPIIALVGKDEELCQYTREGKYSFREDTFYDLAMAPQKKEGWVNIYKCTAGTGRRGGDIYLTKEEAVKSKGIFGSEYITITKVEWEE